MNADGGTNVMESYNKIPKHKTIRFNSRYQKIVIEIKKMFENDWNIKLNGPYFDKKYKSWRIETTKRNDIIKLSKQKIFIHSIKRWRLRKLELILNEGW